MTLGSLWNCYKDKTKYVDDNALEGKSFKYKTQIIGKTPEKPPWHGNLGDVDWLAQPPVPTSDVEVTILLNIIVVFGDQLIYLWLTVKLSLI